MKSTNTLSRNVWIHFVLELVFWNNLSRNLCAEISLGAIFEAGWETKVRQSWFKRWGVSQTCSPFFESHKFLFSHFHLQVKYLNSNSTLNVGASVKITLPSLLLLLSQNQWKTLISLGFVSSWMTTILIGNSLVYIKAHEPQKLHFDLHLCALRLAWVALTTLFWYCGTGVGLSGNQL